MASYARQIPWPTGTALDLAGPQLAWPSSYRPALSTVASIVTGIIFTFLVYNAVVPEKSVLGNRTPSFHSELVKHLRRRWRAWAFLFDAPNIIQDGFNTSHGQPFEVLAPDSRYVFVSSPEHIKEVEMSPENVLSLYAASQQVLQPQYTMHGFNWYEKPTEGVGFVRALRTLLTNNLPEILPNLGVVVRKRFAELHKGHPIVNGVRHSPVARMITKTVVLANVISIFGKELAKNDAFMEAALTYTEELVVSAEIVRLVPKMFRPIIGGLISRRTKGHAVIWDSLLPIAQERCKERELASQGHAVPSHSDCIQWILESTSNKTSRTPQGIVHELMAIWFASVHPTSITITYALQDLCLHPEYTSPLRLEIERDYARFEKSGHGLPLLDSFIKESARLSPVEAQSTRRCALRPFSLSDGTKIDVGDWASTPTAAIMQSAEFYPEPMRFSGFRFVPQELLDSLDVSEPDEEARLKANPHQPSPSKLVDIDGSWYVWGAGRQTCPGRFYAAALAKVIVAQIISNYDLRLVDPEKPRWYTWRTTRVPREETLMVFTPRAE
ncbi:cytochrome P450 [Parachaetomium inaequale]|uniref:Cytochrome P450 n=1 Tax=Parachaetomium inaequale TaxID=2588326 RepID=A0AAN6PBC6_9PEZI|nr:cytochrome P450 [Parachaetomium inaequale]